MKMGAIAWIGPVKPACVVHSDNESLSFEDLSLQNDKSYVRSTCNWRFTRESTQ